MRGYNSKKIKDVPWNTNEIPEKGKFITHATVHERSGNRTIITKPDLS